MKKKLFTLLLAVAASVGTMFARNYYKCGDNLTWSYNEGTITISGTGDMYDYSNNSVRFWNQGDTDITDIKKIIIEEGVTSIGEFAFGWAQVDCPVTEVIISNTVARIGKYAFWCCSSLTSIIIPESVTSIGWEAFNGCSSLSDIFVPCGRLKQFKEMLGEGYYSYQVRYLPLLYTVEGKSNDSTYGKVSVTANVCEGSFVAAIPTRGYQFVRWADGNTENPRTIELSQDTTMEAIFDYLLTGKCGKDSALTWTFEPASMALNITGKGALSENYTYGTFIESLTIGNEVTTIGEDAFYKCTNLKNVILGTSVKVLEARAFYNCSSIEAITCYSQRPPTVNTDALYGLDYSTIVYVPADYLNTYKMHDAWGLYDVRPLGAKSTETTDVNVTPAENTAEVAWPAISGAATYELVIKDKSGNVICTLVFNANGQLTQISFNAPARNNAPQQTQAAGFSFTVTGLESGTSYDLTITSKDNSGTTLDTKTISFTTSGDVPQGIDQVLSDQVLSDQVQCTKVVRNGQIFILRGDKTYTLQGQEVK